MRTLRVVRALYYVKEVRSRAIPITVGGRSSELQLRVYSAESGTIKGTPRITIVTDTTENLPKSRIGRGFGVEVRQLPKGGLTAITVYGTPILGLPDANITADRYDARLWPAIADVLDEILPEYRLV